MELTASLGRLGGHVPSAANARSGPRYRTDPDVARLEGMLSLLDGMGFGGVVVRSGLEIEAMSERARSLLGTVIVDRHGRLGTSCPDTDARLFKIAVRAERRGGHGKLGSLALPRKDKGPMVAHVVAVGGGGGSLERRLAVILADPFGSRAPDEAVLREAFGLTDAEARTAVGICNGLPPSRIAALNGIAEGTVRHQLKAVFVKTDTGRQAQLVALLSRFAPI